MKSPLPILALFILLADNLGNADVGWHGSDIKTPNLDKLAPSGAKLEGFMASKYAAMK